MHFTMAMWMQVVIIPFLVAFICVWLIHPAIAKMAIVRGLTDNPNARKLQKTPVPVLGGMAVFFGIIVSAGVTSIVFNSYALFTCVVTMTVMMYMGFIDDLVGIRPWIRICLEVAVIGFVVIMDLVNINDFHGLFGIGKLPVYVSLPLCAFSGVGIINAINMIDGVDGLSSGLGIFISFVFGCVFFYSHDFTMAVMAFATMGALVPFFFKNVFGHLSKMFIGDSGTMMMGIILCIFCMRTIDNTSRVSRAYPDLGVIAFCLAALSIPVFDTVRVMLLRIYHGGSPFVADKTHLHHVFIRLGFSHIGTTACIITLEFINVLSFFLSFWLGASVTVQFIIVVLTSFITTVGTYFFLSYLDKTHRTYRVIRIVSLYSQLFVQHKFYKTMTRIMDKDMEHYDVEQDKFQE